MFLSGSNSNSHTSASRIPFDIKRDLAAAAGPHLVRIREEIIESSLVISSGGSISSLLCAKSTLSGVGFRNMTTEI